MTALATLTEQDIAQRSANVGRQCGECSLCCLLLDVPEAGKPKHDWCPHCKPGHGCSIYNERPDRCRTYTCAWLVNKNIPDYWRPVESHMIVDFQMTADDRATMRIHVDPQFPTRWLEEPFHSDIKRWAVHGMTREGRRYRTVIMRQGSVID